ncbi:hypothetical protein ADEAN_000825500 [Angomonas deanei]|uniref:Uncharacterized protein n=1 Tax=Angomonas deanei TaxID=59799 RepID=A0A7G2CQB5_9TRYP|nr:hypothetical protein ADEAN_000825500 [Angomonas deanei]
MSRVRVHEASQEQLVGIAKQLRREVRDQATVIEEKDSELAVLREQIVLLSEKCASDEETIKHLLNGVGASKGDPTSVTRNTHQGESTRDDVASIEEKNRELSEINAFYTAIVSQHDLQENKREVGGGIAPPIDPSVSDGQLLQILASEKASLLEVVQNGREDQSAAALENVRLRKQLEKLESEISAIVKRQVNQENIAAPNHTLLESPVDRPKKSEVSGSGPLVTAVTDNPGYGSGGRVGSPLFDGLTKKGIRAADKPLSLRDLRALPPLNIRRPDPREERLLERLDLYKRFIEQQEVYESERQNSFDEIERIRADLFTSMNEQLESQKKEIQALSEGRINKDTLSTADNRSFTLEREILEAVEYGERQGIISEFADSLLEYSLLRMKVILPPSTRETSLGGTDADRELVPPSSEGTNTTCQPFFPTEEDSGVMQSPDKRDNPDSTKLVGDFLSLLEAKSFDDLHVLLSSYGSLLSGYNKLASQSTTIQTSEKISAYELDNVLSRLSRFVQPVPEKSDVPEAAPREFPPLESHVCDCPEEKSGSQSDEGGDVKVVDLKELETLISVKRNESLAAFRGGDKPTAILILKEVKALEKQLREVQCSRLQPSDKSDEDESVCDSCSRCQDQISGDQQMDQEAPDPDSPQQHETSPAPEPLSDAEDLSFKSISDASARAETIFDNEHHHHGRDAVQPFDPEVQTETDRAAVSHKINTAPLNPSHMEKAVKPEPDSDSDDFVPDFDPFA